MSDGQFILIAFLGSSIALALFLIVAHLSHMSKTLEFMQRQIRDYMQRQP
jgi:hypothetical protein